MSCGHSFCQQCLEQVIERKNICPLDRSPIQRLAINYALLDVVDPGVEISSQQETLLSAMKGKIGSLKGPTLAILPSSAEPAPIIVHRSQEESMRQGIEDLHLEELIDPRNGCPRRVGWHDYNMAQINNWEASLLQSRPNHSSSHLLYLLGILAWARQQYCSGRKLELILTTVILRSDQLKEIGFAHFARAYLEINHGDRADPDFKSARKDFQLAKENPATLPVHQVLSEFYLDCFHFRGLGGAEKSDDLAYGGLLRIKDDPILPEPQKAFAELMVGEGYLLGVGLQKSPSLAESLFESVAKNLDATNGVRSKAYYWLGLIYKTNWEKALTYFSRAHYLINKDVNRPRKFDEKIPHFYPSSASGATPPLEKKFRLGNKYPATPPSVDKFGPHYESYLDLNIHKLESSCILALKGRLRNGR